MELTLGKKSALVRIAERYERYWGRKADAGICVTKAMKHELAEGWNIPTTVFYDRPPSIFKKATVEEMHELLGKLQDSLAAPMHKNDFIARQMMQILMDGSKLKHGDSTNRAALTKRRQSNTIHNKSADRQYRTVCTVLDPGTGKVTLRAKRPVIVVSSTSWTPDEDFGILLGAARRYDAHVLKSKSSTNSRTRASAASAAEEEWPSLLIFVTGRGPQRASYELQMQQLDLQYVAFRTVWLEPQDYPVLLGCADLGVSLHASSSGLDLPMKVVDMFGCGLPVCAKSYSCIEELVLDGKNGLLFHSEEELFECLVRVFSGEEEGGRLLERLRNGVASGKFERWHENWMRIVKPLLLQ